LIAVLIQEDLPLLSKQHKKIPTWGKPPKMVGKPPKWMVYNYGKPYLKWDDLGGKPTIEGNTP